MASNRFTLLLLFCCAWHAVSSHAAGVIVAASNTLSEAKSRATLLCDGVDDQVELSAAFSTAGGASVEWLPGDYYLSGTVTIPVSGNNVLQAAGSHLHYAPTTGDAIVIKGAMHSRINLGVIECATSGAALRLQNETGVNMLVSIFTFTGLVGHGRLGQGLVIDTSEEGISTNRIEGSEITGFDVGVHLPDTYVGKIDTTWFWINSIRNCNTGIWEGNERIDTHFFRAAIRSGGAGTLGMRTAGTYDRVDLVAQGEFNNSAPVVKLATPARHNVILVRPTAAAGSNLDQSGNATNILLSLDQAPYAGYALPLLSSVYHFEWYE